LALDQLSKNKKYEDPKIIMRVTDKEEVDYEVLRKNQLKNFQHFYDNLDNNLIEGSPDHF